MARHLIIYGHGAGDPGAVGNGTNERDFNRQKLHPYMKKWTDKSKDSFVFFDTSGSRDMFQETAQGWGMYSIKPSDYATISEYHEDAAGASATGGHVIVSSSFKADNTDLSMAQLINRIVGLWGGVSHTNGISYRSNLLNLNVAAQRGLNYRLTEIGFITSSRDMAIINRELDQLAKGFIESITGEKLGITPEKEKPKVIKNDRPKHAVLTGRFEVGSAAEKKVEAYINATKWNFRKIYSENRKRVQFEVAKFNQYDLGKFRLEKWLAENNYSFEVLSSFSEVTNIKNNDRPRHHIETGGFDKGSDSYKLVKSYLQKNKWNFKEEEDKNKRIRFITGMFNQNDNGKFRLEKWLADNNYSYQVL